MNYKILGKSGIKVSTIGLGTMTWGEQNSEKQAFEQMDYAEDAGINFFDTAELYPVPPSDKTRGETSRIIGRWIKNKKNRNKIIIADKIVGRSGMNWFRENSEQTRLNKSQISFALDRSLKDLDTDYIDLYQLHWPDRPINVFSGLEYVHKETQETNTILEVIETLEECIKKGKIRSFGISNETPWGTSEYLKYSETKNFSKPVSIQNPYNLLNRSFEVGLSEISIRENVGLLAYSPLASGTLSGKYLDGKLPEGSRLKLFGNRYPRYRTPNSENAIKEYIKIANTYNLNPCQMAIKFCEIKPFVTSVLIGATKIDQLKINIDSVNIKLHDKILEDINKIQLIYSNPCP
ncbi:MAG: aldo/keto reductase [Candidatus Pelagibacter sp.]|nr:aldo/keto reductase [Candidatus Pelagibacter sp.]OUV97668.1 MAG: aldo/keto reductase [Candidatus Pelagibacter sp. TMED142]|tara:strand:+ start:990 stop:2036 length:1047 start_codon:yes stop_codon:yes gene_type:complete